MSLKSFVVLSVAVLGLSELAYSTEHPKKKDGHSHHNHNKGKKSLEAHVHGSAALNLALESDHHLELEMDIPGMDVVGFEHGASTTKEKALVTKTKTKIELGLASALGLPTTCKIESSKIEVHNDKESHSEWEIAGEVHCENSLKGQKVTLDFSPLFPKLEELKVQYVSENQQKSFNFKKGRGDLSFD